MHQVPMVLNFVSVSTLGALLGSNRALRNQVQKHVTKAETGRRYVPLQQQVVDVKQLVWTQWPNLKELKMAGSHFQVRDIQRLCQINWQHLRSLDLGFANLDLPCLQLLAQGGWCSLKALQLCFNNLHGDRMATLLQGRWPSLKTLGIQSCNIDCESISHLVAAQLQLEELDMSLNYLTTAAIAQVCKGQWLQLRKLGLSHSFYNRVTNCSGKLRADRVDNEELSPAFMHHLSAAAWPNLEDLDLSSNSLNVNDLKVLVECQWPGLSSLKVGGHQLSAEGYVLLGQAKWPLLQSLDLSGMDIDHKCMSHLVSAEWPFLRALRLSHTYLGMTTCTWLTKARWPCLDSLYIFCCEMNEIGMAALAKGSWPNLATLLLQSQTFTSVGMQHLLTSNWPNLETLGLPNLEIALNEGIVQQLSHNSAIYQAGMNTLDSNDALPVVKERWPSLRVLHFDYIENV